MALKWMVFLMFIVVGVFLGLYVSRRKPKEKLSCHTKGPMYCSAHAMVGYMHSRGYNPWRSGP